MKVRRQKEESVLAIWIVAGLMLLGMAVLVSELWKLQVPRKSGFEEVFLSQSVRRVRLPAVRGKIYDAKGVCLADSVPDYCIAIYTEELRAQRSAVANTLELMLEIEKRIGQKPSVSYRDIKRHITFVPDQPLVAWQDLDRASIALWRARFEQWTAPPEGALTNKRKKIRGLDLDRPVEGSSIVIQTSELAEKSTSTVANTLELIYEIAERLGERDIPVTLQDIKNHIYDQRPLPLLAWKNIDEKTMARWAETCSVLVGTDIYCQPDRHYPEGENFAHLIGFTLEADAAREEGGERVHFDLRGIEGKKGLEGTYNRLLEGRPGSRLVQIDVAGYHYRDLQTKPPQPGGDLQLTIDANLQRFAKEALLMRQDGEANDVPVRGAVVVLDPNNGDVLAMASAPSFNPNAYMQSKLYRQALLKDPSSRTYHRAVFGQYPPGSTFKPIVALGALKDHPGYGATNHVCRGSLVVDRREMNCWDHGGHGEIDLREALMHSCNVYMFEMAQAVGYEAIRDMAGQFGLGQYAGLFPDLEEVPEQKELKYGNLPAHADNTIDLCNMSIGQGALTASPLQMAMVAATIANGGTLYRPRLVQKWRNAPDEEYRKNPTWAIRRIDVPMAALELVRGGMYDVVMDEDGTAKKARVPGLGIAGKTGSAQYKKLVDGEVVESVHTWMISYAPFDFPRYAVAMLVEDGVSGGNTIGPRLSALYQKIFEYDGTLARKEEK
jgi:penicillin-binding protein 2